MREEAFPTFERDVRQHKLDGAVQLHYHLASHLDVGGPRQHRHVANAVARQVVDFKL
jgi:hypothetical protein